MPLNSLVEMKLRDGMVIEESDSFYERLTGKVSTGTLRPSWLIFSGTSRRILLYGQIRRLLDVTLSGIGLVLSLPMMALAAIAIRLESSGPILYRQVRVGQHNRRFTIMKFRSMKVDAEPDGPVWAEENGPRITRVGRVIRKLRIDELPQFINIIRGEMSFIGPRPERPEFVEQLEADIPYYSQRHLVKPGLTGWAQIRYPYCASIEDAIQKLQYDLYYIKNQSLLLDVITLFETARIVLFGRGAR
jgi:sugar transferase (PEP-CTERM system associated)